MIQQCLFPVVLVDSKVLDKQEKNPGWMMLVSTAGECNVKVCLKTAYGWDLLLSPYVYSISPICCSH